MDATPIATAPVLAALATVKMLSLEQIHMLTLTSYLHHKLNDSMTRTPYPNKLVLHSIHSPLFNTRVHRVRFVVMAAFGRVTGLELVPEYFVYPT